MRKTISFIVCLMLLTPAATSAELLKWEVLANNCSSDKAAEVADFQANNCPDKRVLSRCVEGKMYAQCAPKEYREDCSEASLMQFDAYTGKNCYCQDRGGKYAEIVCY